MFPTPQSARLRREQIRMVTIEFENGRVIEIPASHVVDVAISTMPETPALKVSLELIAPQAVMTQHVQQDQEALSDVHYNKVNRS